MRFCILGSGSKGNAVLVDAGGQLVLIDCGFSPKEIRRRMSDVGCELTQLRGLLITHGHGDHIKGARKLASGMNLLTYTTDDTVAFCARRSPLVNHARVVPGVPFRIGPQLTVTAFSTPHDAKGSVGFVFDDGNARFGYCTDLGAPDANVIDALGDVDAMVLEFNHDSQMLQHGPYPSHLKRRVASRYGHLSNDEAAEILSATTSPRLRRVVLAHLSEVNNTPRLALAAAAAAVGSADVAIQVAPQHAPSVWFSVGEKHVSSPTLSVVAAPTRDALVDARALGDVTTGTPYGMHPSVLDVAEIRADVPGGAPGRSTHARAAARARAERLFGADPRSVTRTTTAVRTLVARPESEMPHPERLDRDVVSTSNRARPSGAGLAVKLATRAADERAMVAAEEARTFVVAGPETGAEGGPEPRGARPTPPSTSRAPSSKRSVRPMIAKNRQLSLFGGAGDDA